VQAAMDGEARLQAAEVGLANPGSTTQNENRLSAAASASPIHRDGRTGVRRVAERTTKNHVYYNNRKQREAAERLAERRKREDAAPRLTAEVPRLQSLTLEIQETSEGSSVAEPTHVRRIVVQHAPALFVLPCGDSRCKDGGHDVTHAVMRPLRAGETRFEGQDACAGSLGTAPCTRVLNFVGTATYA
jgi:hypothetical protein